MMMLAPVPMRVAVVAPRVVSPIIVAVRSIKTARIVASRIVAVTIGAVVTPVHDDRGGSNDDGCGDAETDVDLDPSLSGLRGHKQGQSQERNHTPHTEEMCETFHCHILTLQQRLYATSGRVIGHMLLHICCCVEHCSILYTRRKVARYRNIYLECDLLLSIYYRERVT
jgi:hypothetical protein